MPFVALGLLATVGPGNAADNGPQLRLDPRKPIIDLGRDTRKPPPKARPVVRRKVRKVPQTPRPVQRTYTQQPKTQDFGAANTSSGGSSGVTRQSLPPLPGAEDAFEANGPGNTTPERRDDRIDRLTRQPEQRVARRTHQGRSASDLPRDLWRGVSMKRFEALSRDYAVRPRSRAIRKIWIDLFASNSAPPRGAHNAASFDALRMQGLFRLGAFSEIVAHADATPADERYAKLKILAAKARIALGDDEEACGSAKTLISASGKVPLDDQRAFVEISAYCAILADDMSRAGIIVELARDRGIDAPETFSMIDAMTLSKVPQPPGGRRLRLIPGKLLILSGYAPKSRFMDLATPALLLSLANDQTVASDVRLAASERAATLGILSPTGLREIYLETQAGDSAAGQRASAIQRIAKAARGGRADRRVLQLAQNLLKRARGKALYPILAATLGPDIRNVRQNRETRDLAETAIEITTAFGQYNAAVGWAIFASSYDTAGAGGSGDQMHWLTPIGIADARGATPRGGGLNATNVLAKQGRFSPNALHRLVTVLDGLGYTNIPIPLWDAASRAPQPVKGYLPKTGVLGELKVAARDRQVGHTLLLAAASLGPDGGAGAHLIALGDTLRALRTAGLEARAREIASEVVFPLWPRRFR